VSHLLEPDDLGLLQHLDGPGRPSLLSCRNVMSQYRRGILDTMPLYLVGVTVDKRMGHVLDYRGAHLMRANANAAERASA
jgi:hypothetical protein